MKIMIYLSRQKKSGGGFTDRWKERQTVHLEPVQHSGMLPNMRAGGN